MRHFICATAGHIDHGKTTLIKNLTGIDTDTTEEERSRGLSINLGFAYLDLAEDLRVGFVDVPGHQRFIKNMIAGITGIDAVMLVVDANESVMPQTVEHMEILSLMGMKDFIVVLTKADTLEPEYLDLAVEDVKESLVGTAAEGAPVVVVDSISKRGFEDLKKELLKVSERTLPKRLDVPPRMYIDRSFSVKGAGTVVTGTLLCGVMKKDAQLCLYPGNLMTRARGLQVHEQAVDVSYAGSRTAINLSDVTTEEASRGHLLTASMNLEPVYMADVQLTVTKSARKDVELKDRVRVYFGSNEVMARVFPLNSAVAERGEDSYAQLRFEEPVYISAGDRMIIRNYSPMYTVGGATVLDTNPKKHAKLTDELLSSLATKLDGSTEDVVADALESAEELVFTRAKLASKLSVMDNELDDAIRSLVDEGRIIELDGAFIAFSRQCALEEEVKMTLLSFHKRNPLKRGMSREELRKKVPGIEKKYFDKLLAMFAQNGSVKLDGDTVCIFDFVVAYNPAQQKIYDEIIDMLDSDGFSPRDLSGMAKDAKFKEVLDSMLADVVVYLDGIYMSRKYYDKATAFVIETIKKSGNVALAQLRDFTDSSRKYCVAILDRMDRENITKRVGDVRVLVKGR